MKKLTMASADWTCPAIDNRKGISFKDKEKISAMENPEKLKELVDQSGQESGKGIYILPALQNLEAFAYSRDIQSRKRDPGPEPYRVKCLKELEDYTFDLLSLPLIRALLETIPFYKDKPLILEAEAPFSLLAGLMDPMNLYLCFSEEPLLLENILMRIASASAEYIKACLKAGCRVISLADPVGTMNMVGEEYYRSFCGKASLVLMKECDPFLDKGIIHLCRKMSQSLLIAEMAESQPWTAYEGTNPFKDTLFAMAEDPEIHFTGMTCIHGLSPDSGMPCRILPGKVNK